MRIVNGKKFYKKDMDAALVLPFSGWDFYNWRNHQWYTVRYNPDCGYTCLIADNSGDCYGDYEDRYFSSPREFYRWAREHNRDVDALIGDVPEDNAAAMRFVEEMYKEGA